MFKDYTQENCLLECRSRLLLDRCRCLPYFYPRLDLLLRERREFRHLRDNKTCTWQGWQCLKNATGEQKQPSCGRFGPDQALSLLVELLDAIAPLSPPSPSSAFSSSPSDLLMRSLSTLDDEDDDDGGDGGEADPDPRRTLLQGGAPCNCPPTCARTTYSATLSSARFPNGASRLRKLLHEEEPDSDRA